MNQYFKYILLIILGIILFTLLNNRENFSIGNQVIMKLNDFIKEDISEVISSGCVLCAFDRIFRFPVVENTPKKVLEKLKSLYTPTGVDPKDINTIFREAWIESRPNDEVTKESIQSLNIDDKVLFKEGGDLPHPSIAGQRIRNLKDAIKYIFTYILLDNKEGILVSIELMNNKDSTTFDHQIIFYKDSNNEFNIIDNNEGFTSSDIEELTTFYNTYLEEIDYKPTLLKYMGNKGEEIISLDGGMHDIDAANIKTFHDASLSFFKEKNFLKSIEILEYALFIDSEDKGTKEALDYALKELPLKFFEEKKFLKSNYALKELSLKFFEEKDFLKSIEILEYGLSIYPEDEEMREALDYAKEELSSATTPL